jgi:hypothetical protein
MLSGFGDFMNASGEKPPGVDVVVSKPVTLDAMRDVLAIVGLRPGEGPPAPAS